MDQERSAKRASTVDYSEETEFHEAVTVSSWIIKNFNSKNLGFDGLRSSEFPFKLGQSTFITSIIGLNDGLDVHFKVNYFSKSPMDVKITEPRATVTLRNKKGLELASKSGNCKRNILGDLEFVGIARDFENRHRKDLIDNVLEVETKVVQPYHSTKRIHSHLSLEKSLVQDLLTLYESKESADVTFNIKKQNFSAHKSIICARSEVFKAMFSSEMIEGKTNHVQIDDIEPRVFEKLLRYIYTDEIGEIEGLHLELAYAADKYGLRALKIFCENELFKGMNDEDALKTLKYAYSCGNQTMKDKATDYIVNNIKKLSRSDIYVVLKDPEFVTHVIAAFQTFKSNK